MAQIDTAQTFADGNTVNAAALNNMVDQATALEGIIEDQIDLGGGAIDAINDELLIRDASAAGNKLRRAKISKLPVGGTVTSVAMTATPTTVFDIAVTGPTAAVAIALTLDQQAPNTVLAGPASGTGAATPGFRTLSPADVSISSHNIPVFDIDPRLSNIFSKTLTDNVSHVLTFVLDSGASGQRIMVWVQRGGTSDTADLNWVAAGGNIYWPNGTQPQLTDGNGRIDIFEFLCFGSNRYYGIRWGVNMQL